jgi:hypothetical protein
MLATLPYEPNNPAISYRRLLRGLTSLKGWTPQGIDESRFKLFVLSSLHSIAVDLIAEVWSVNNPAFSSASRGHLAEAILKRFEEVAGS